MKATLIIPILALLAGAVAAQLPSIEERTEGLVKHEGYVTFWWDAGAGKLWAEFRPGEQLIYVYSLATGLGSNPVGLDRKQLGGTRLVALRRVGPKLLLVQPNLKFRANWSVWERLDLGAIQTFFFVFHREPAICRTATTFTES